MKKKNSMSKKRRRDDLRTKQLITAFQEINKQQLMEKETICSRRNWDHRALRRGSAPSLGRRGGRRQLMAEKKSTTQRRAASKDR